MTSVDESKLQQLLGQVIGDLGAVTAAPLVVIGDELGLYRAMADGRPISAAGLAERTGTAERYVREWVAAQAASGYVTFDGMRDGTAWYRLEPEQVEAFVNEASPAFVVGGFQAFGAAVKVLPRLIEAFRTGRGIGWDEHDPALFQGTARFFHPGYAAYLVGEWLPALDGVVGKLTAGGRVADVGCGYGYSTLLMAEAFPASTFAGFDYHQPSIDTASKLAADARVAGRVSFQVGRAAEFPGTGYDLITYFDCLHDMGDPVGALAHARETLAADGSVMLVEPFAGNTVGDNLNPLGRAFYGASTLICTPASLAQEVGRGLGAQAGEDALRQVAAEAGFSRFRRATQTPFNLVLQAQP
jgi:SAM-dependent methyltransferase